MEEHNPPGPPPFLYGYENEEDFVPIYDPPDQSIIDTFDFDSCLRNCNGLVGNPQFQPGDHSLDSFDPLLLSTENGELTAQTKCFASPKDESMISRSPTPRKRKFECPWFEAETAQNLSHSCNGSSVESMADVRRHMTRGQEPHVPFLRLCPTCNTQFLNKSIFDKEHGYKGELCHYPKKQCRGEAAQRTQWAEIYNMIFEEVKARKEAQSDVLALPAVAIEIAPYTPASSQPAEPQSRPYLTPYELIFDSDSDDTEDKLGAYPMSSTNDSSTAGC